MCTPSLHTLDCDERRSDTRGTGVVFIDGKDLVRREHIPEKVFCLDSM